MKQLIYLFIMSAAFTACNNGAPASSDKASPAYEKGSFGYDLNFLNKYDSIIVLSNEGEDARVAVSPRYQAKVFTSSAGKENGTSFGWINYKAFGEATDPHMNAYGGENRFWLGPEGGRYSLFFKKGDKMVFDNWKTPAAIDTEPWEVLSAGPQMVSMQKDMKLENYAGTALQIRANRTITVLTGSEIAAKLGLKTDTGFKAVGYLADNSITNTGSEAWNETTGMPCIWNLDMFNPSEKTVIVIPYKTEGFASDSKVATTDYFGEIPADRIKYKDGVLLFTADGKSRGKLGLAPQRARPVAGSYDPENGILTLTLFDLDPGAKYLNQEWNTDKPPFSGDAVNAYNDGPLEDGSQMGPFYEIESVSPAAFLEPQSSLRHRHYVFHFTGSEPALDAIARQVLQISLADIQQ